MEQFDINIDSRILKESMYMLDWQILYVPCFKKFKNTIVSSHRKSDHVFTIWQRLVLLTIIQYEGKSYRMFFVERLIEANYLRLSYGCHVLYILQRCRNLQTELTMCPT